MPTSSEPDERTARTTLMGLPVPLARLVLATLALAFVFYSLLWRQAPYANLNGDSPTYMEAARQIVAGPGNQVPDRVPGYPLLLVVTGSTNAPTRALFYVSLLLHAATTWMLAVALHAAHVRKRLIFLMACAINLPPAVEPAAVVLSENLCQALLVGAYGSLVLWRCHGRWPWLAAASLLFSTTALVRPTYQAVAICMAAALLLTPRILPSAALARRSAVQAAMALALAWFVIVGGYAARNRVRYGYLGVTPLLGFNLSTRTAAFLEDMPERYAPVRKALIEARDQSLLKPGSSHTGYMYIWSVIPELEHITGLNRVQLSGYMMRLNIDLIKRSPASYLGEVLRSAGGYVLPAWGGRIPGFANRGLVLLWTVAHFAIAGVFLAIASAAFGIGLVFGARRRFANWTRAPYIGEPPERVFAYAAALLLVIYTWLISTAFEMGNPRYRVPTDPLIVGMIMLGASICWEQIKGHTIEPASTPAAKNKG